MGSVVGGCDLVDVEKIHAWTIYPGPKVLGLGRNPLAWSALDHVGVVRPGRPYLPHTAARTPFAASAAAWVCSVRAVLSGSGTALLQSLLSVISAQSFLIC